MKRIKQVTLYYQDDRSDKVYAVELVSVGSEGYIVNFRYGRRGGNLKEDTKTPHPVSLQAAEAIFDKLVKEKTKKGYEERGDEDFSEGEEGEFTREERILDYLQGEAPESWPLHRIIWRAGELKLAEATPHLIPLLGTGDNLRDYCIVYALGLCGDHQALPVLQRLEENNATPEFVRRIAFEAIWKLGDRSTQEQLQQKVYHLLPPLLQHAITQGNLENFRQHLLLIHLRDQEYEKFKVIDLLYQSHLDIARPALLEFIRTAPFAPPAFQSLRHLFKMAEYRQDGEVFGLLAARFEREKGSYNPKGYYLKLPDGTYLSRYEYLYNPQTRRHEITRDRLTEEYQKPNPRVAYSQATRNYLRQRVWRTLRKLGKAGDLGYVDLARGVLLAYSDADAQPIKHTAYYRWTANWSQRVKYENQWDRYSAYLSFCHILYTNSSRYFWKQNGQAWRCAEGYKPGDPPPETREEAFPELWNQRPDALLELLLKSQCHPVHQFAVRALRDRSDFFPQITLDNLLTLFSQPYQETTTFALTLARSLYTPEHPQQELVLALLQCHFLPARTQACEWVIAQPAVFLNSSEFLFQLLLSPHVDVKEFVRQIGRSHAIPEETAKLIIGRIVTELLNFTTPEGVEAIGETLLIIFPTPLSTLSLSVILDLLQHSLPPIQTLGARLLLHHQTPATELPSHLIESLILSTQESIRRIGVEIFGQLGDTQLREYHRDAILAMILSPVADLRQSIQPVVAHLATDHPEFSTSLATELIPFLLSPEPHPGVHQDVLILLRDRLPLWQTTLPGELTLTLLNSRYPQAQDLGGVILQHNSQRLATEWSIADIVKLASNEVLNIRRASWAMIANSLDRIRASAQEKLAAIRLLEAKWEDSRQFAQGFFQHHFTDRDWTPEVMVLVCDSIRQEVREFGRQLVTRTFASHQGEDYLLKFSEHPSPDMQAFASQYLHSYASDNPQRLEELKPYLITVLSQVNRGRVAKHQVLAFLEQEALKSEAAATVIAEVLTRQSATMAIADKARCLQIMLRLHHHYPHISLPLQIKPITEIRS